MISWVRISVKVLVLGIIMLMIIIIVIVICHIQQYTPTDQAYDKFLAVNIAKKCKHMSDFPAVTLWTFC